MWLQKCVTKKTRSFAGTRKSVVRNVQTQNRKVILTIRQVWKWNETLKLKCYDAKTDKQTNIHIRDIYVYMLKCTRKKIRKRRRLRRQIFVVGYVCRGSAVKDFFLWKYVKHVVVRYGVLIPDIFMAIIRGLCCPRFFMATMRSALFVTCIYCPFLGSDFFMSRRTRAERFRVENR